MSAHVHSIVALYQPPGKPWDTWWMRRFVPWQLIADEQMLAVALPVTIEQMAEALIREGFDLEHVTWEAVAHGPLNPKESHR